jgi:hypothetical protein
MDDETGRYKAGKYKGKTSLEAQTLMRDAFTSEVQSNPGLIEKWASRAKGDMGGGARGMGQLPEGVRSMPNAPDLSGFQQFDKQGRQVSGPSPSARMRFMDMVGQAASRKAAAKQAVQDRIQWQKENPEAVADMSIAAKDAQLAESGITDLGGGTKAMTNKYGTGFATNMTPQEAADRKAGKTFGTIMDEKGVVDVKGMMANKGAGTTTPYQPGSTETPSLNLDARDANRADIQSKIAAAIPGAADRRAADRAKVIEAVKGAVPAPAAPMATVANPARTAPMVGLGGMVTPNLTPGEVRKREVDALPLGADMASKAIYDAKMYGAGRPKAPVAATPSVAPQPAAPAATPQPPPSASVMPTSNPNYAIQRGSGVGAATTPPQAAPSPQIEAIKAGAKAVPGNVMKGLAAGWDGMKRTLIGS